MSIETAAPPGPTQMDPSQTWAPRRGFARVLRVSAFALPISLSLVFSFVLISIMPAPATAGQTAGWWATLAIAVVLFALGTENLFKKLIPAASLLELSLTFPDAAPSRFTAALRTRTVRSLQRDIAAGNLDPAAAPNEAASQLIEMATALTNHDRATRGHTERVRAYSVLIAEELGVPDSEIEKLRWAAMVHDIGKLKVAPEILNTPGRPTDEQWEELAKHPFHSAEYAEPLREWLGDWVDAAGQHHEKWDGSGYPLGLSGSEISLSARIVAVADAFDVMTSVRSYKAGIPIDEAKAELARCAGKQFDPEVVKAMLSVSIPRRRVGGATAWAAQIPILGKSWPNGGIMAATTVSAAMAAITLSPGPFQPELIAYSNFSAAEDSSLRVEIAPAPQPDRVTIIDIDGPALASWDGSAIVIVGLPNASGEVTVTYEACWEEECRIGKTTVTFVPVNDDPTPVDDAVTAIEPGPVTINPLANDSDLEQDELSIESVLITRGDATATVRNDAILVTPTTEAAQLVDVDYVVVDGAGGRARATARVTFPDFNDAPVATADLAEVFLGESITVDVLANDTDTEPGKLSLIEVRVDKTLGSATIVDNTVRFTASSAVGSTPIEYVVSDGTASSTGTLTVTVLAPPPVTTGDRLTTAEDTASSLNVLANDGAPGSSIDPTSLRIQSSSLGQAVHLGNGVIRFTPEPDAYGIGSVAYSVCNTFGSCSNASVVVEVVRINDLPFFTPGEDVSATTNAAYDRPWATGGSVGEANEPTQMLTYSVDTADPALFSTQPQISPGGYLTFTAGGGPGQATITVIASDGLEKSLPVTFTITITD